MWGTPMELKIDFLDRKNTNIKGTFLLNPGIRHYSTEMAVTFRNG